LFVANGGSGDGGGLAIRQRPQNRNNAGFDHEQQRRMPARSPHKSPSTSKSQCGTAGTSVLVLGSNRGAASPCRPRSGPHAGDLHNGGRRMCVLM